jgi:hypothetical protein
VTFPLGVGLLLLGWYLWANPVTVIGDLSGLATFGALVSYGLVVVASVKEYWAEDVAARRPLPALISLAGFAALAYVLYANIYPVPGAPVKYFPYIAIGYFVLTMGGSAAYRAMAGAIAPTDVDAFTEATSSPATLVLDVPAPALSPEGALADVADRG